MSNLPLQDDRILEVVNTQACRTLLLCEKHVALVRSKSLALRSTYRSMWVVPISEIKIVRGKHHPPKNFLQAFAFKMQRLCISGQEKIDRRCEWILFC